MQTATDKAEREKLTFEGERRFFRWMAAAILPTVGAYLLGSAVTHALGGNRDDAIQAGLGAALIAVYVAGCRLRKVQPFCERCNHSSCLSRSS